MFYNFVVIQQNVNTPVVKIKLKGIKQITSFLWFVTCSIYM